MTFTILFQNRRLRTGMALTTSLALLLTTSAGVSVKASDTETFKQQVLNRVDSVTESGYVHSHLEDAQGNIYKEAFTENAETASFSERKLSTKKATNLPSRYDLRDYGHTTSIKDQGKSGCCWAFSAIKAIESNGIRSGLFSLDLADFSESHLAWFSYHVSSDLTDPLYGDGMSAASQASSLFNNTAASTYAYDHGGSATLATFTLARGSGPVAENIAPFNASSPSAIQLMADDMTQKSQLRYNASYRLKNSISFDEYTVGENYYYKNTDMITDMKQSIIDNGAMSIGLFYDKTLLKTNSAGTTYYQRYYTGDSAVKNANHCVTIIGWDDNFSRFNFASQPSRNGAWLIANSYGTEFGDNGYFWLSYYEQSICDCFSFIIEPTDTYQNVYQYDGFGWSSATSSSTNDVKAANVFTANTDSPQALKAVSFYTLTDNQEYKIEIYRDVNSGPIDGVRIDTATTTGTLKHNGYHTIPLSTPVNIAAGEKFSVVITYVQSGSKTVFVPFEGKKKTTSEYSLQYASKTGQSYLYTKLITTTNPKWVDLFQMGYNNACIKVYADNTSAADVVQAYIGKVTIGKGESYQLSNHTSNYSSANPSIATVSSSGKIKGIRVGQTTITISTGISTKTMDVIVKKAPSRLRIKPSGRKKVKKGKKFRIKVKLPSGSASNKITYRSSRKKIVSVNSKGIVTAKRKGKAVITVKTYNGKKAKLKVIVKKK